ncbi:tellurite resistance/C4-dicarboxylate transporter family protein [Streptomyces mauvecolor]|uniref:Tellurite resistance/C4-dicarboxylate transporter family protein n=1 Tax=Streptomyces mauvecolor TaxID=58345 RepID=A0ABV9UUN7_9ACTN
MKRQVNPWWAELPPAAGAAVMATAIISIGLHLTGHETLSRVGLVIAALLWLLLAWDFVARLLGNRTRWEGEADTPPALTAVAATTVLGTRLSALGWQGPAAALLTLGAVLWPGLLMAVVRHWRRRMPGVAFLVCVATQGLAVLAATLSSAGAGEWLGWGAVAALGLGLFLYAEALVRFDFRQVRDGAGDQWIGGGALAISALAASKLALLRAGAAHTALRTTALVLLGLNLTACAVLLLAEARWPRPRYDIRRWSTVFPLGMTAVASLSVSATTGIAWLHTLGVALLWIALATWLLVLAGFARKPGQVPGGAGQAGLWRSGRRSNPVQEQRPGATRRHGARPAPAAPDPKPPPPTPHAQR